MKKAIFSVFLSFVVFGSVVVWVSYDRSQDKKQEATKILNACEVREWVVVKGGRAWPYDKKFYYQCKDNGRIDDAEIGLSGGVYHVFAAEQDMGSFLLRRTPRDRQNIFSN